MNSMTRRDLFALSTLVLSEPLLARTNEHEVLAFYYGWYGTREISGQLAHWPEGTADEPSTGLYDSHDPKVIEAQFSEMKGAGVTGVIVSWWRSGDFQDQGMLLLLNAADRIGLKVTIYYEISKPRKAPAPEATADDLQSILSLYANHPAWLRARGKPVVFVYSRAISELHLVGWEQVIAQVNRRYAGGVCFVGDEISKAASRVFEGIHTYNPTGETANMTIDDIRAWAKANYPKWVAAAGKKISCVTVIPGYDDVKLKRPGTRPTTRRYEGETYRVLWQAAIAARPDWVLITSWNEWHEGSEIEPSKEYGDRELKATADFARRFRRGD